VNARAIFMEGSAGHHDLLAETRSCCDVPNPFNWQMRETVVL
jgi:hypothetical protein